MRRRCPKALLLHARRTYPPVRAGFDYEKVNEGHLGDMKIAVVRIGDRKVAIPARVFRTNERSPL